MITSREKIKNWTIAILAILLLLTYAVGGWVLHKATNPDTAKYEAQLKSLAADKVIIEAAYERTMIKVDSLSRLLKADTIYLNTETTSIQYINKQADEKRNNFNSLPPTKQFDIFAAWVSKADSLGW